MSKAKVFQLHPERPNPRQIKGAVDVLRAGGIIVYPTDTVYGLGCDIHRADAVDRIMALKRRDQKKPFSFLCKDLSQVSEYAAVSNVAYRVLRQCLPGPYTFILPSTRKTPRVLQSKRRTVGIRIADHGVPMALVEALGSPILTTSANVSSGETPGTIDGLKELFGNNVDLYLEAGPLSGAPSSVVSLLDDQVDVLREGAGDLSLFL